MSKHAATLAAVYLAAGVGVAAWTAYRGQSQQPHWEGLTANSGVALVSIVALWPVAIIQNLRA